jgi:protein involved in polysaccharide export with SLBB domain
MNKTAFLLLLSVLLLMRMPSYSQSAENILRPGDSIMVKLSGVPAEESAVVSSNYDISDGGTINLPYIGEVNAAGQRPSQLQKSIEAAYKSRDIYTHPTILVSSDKSGPTTQVIFVSGEVKAPGRVPMSVGMTTHDCITSVGGPNEWARMNKVKFTRNTITKELDLKKADNPDSRIQVQPGDRIHVSR